MGAFVNHPWIYLALIYKVLLPSSVQMLMNYSLQCLRVPRNHFSKWEEKGIHLQCAGGAGVGGTHWEAGAEDPAGVGWWWRCLWNHHRSHHQLLLVTPSSQTHVQISLADVSGQMTALIRCCQSLRVTLQWNVFFYLRVTMWSFFDQIRMLLLNLLFLLSLQYNFLGFQALDKKSGKKG